MSVREVLESPLTQGVDEQIQYSVTTTPWGTGPSSVAVEAKDETGASVKSTVMPSGSPSVSGDVITLPVMTALTAAKEYRVEVKFTAEGNVWETFFIVRAET